MTTPQLPAPHDSWAERNLIGACTWKPALLERAVDAGIEPGHFYHPEHRRLFAALYDEWLAGRDPDPGLARDGTTGPAYTAPHISAPELYAEQIIDCARRRRLILEALGIERPHLDWPAYWAARAEARRGQ